MNKTQLAVATILGCILASASLVEAQTLHLQTLVSFNNTNGANPYSALKLGADGNFYGTTEYGGNTSLNGGYGYGTVFKVTTNGTLTRLFSFSNTNGAQPEAALAQGNDGNFYGTTQLGGSNGLGTVFQVTTNGTLTTLASFNNGNGATPQAALTLGNDGNFYGTTYYGGTSGWGTVFQVTTNGALTTLVSFANTNGAEPNAALTQGNDGNFYGTTQLGGGGYGTVFGVTTNGTLTTLVSFSNTNGAQPVAALTLGSDGNFYGTTQQGGSGGLGTVFQVTTNGILTTLVSFSSGNGATPQAALTLGNDGNFYGTTFYGGSSDRGTMFQVTTNGTLTTLISFTNTNGAEPNAALTLGPDGNFYGTTFYGGSRSQGTVFRLSLTPAITVQPTSQTNYAGATVIFNVVATNLFSAGFQWQKNGANLVDGGNLSGSNTRTLTITAISDNDAAIYSVVVSNASFGAVTSSKATLTVNDFPLFFVAQPLSQTIGVGSNVTFTATAYGAPPFILQWFYNDVPVGSPISGTNVTSYTLTDVQTNQSGNYTVQVINGYGSVMSSNAVLTVAAFAPSITTQPSSQQVEAGSNVVFSVSVSGTAPFNYQWFFGDTAIPDATNAIYAIPAVTTNDTGNYSVVVSNAVDIATSSNAVLTVEVFPPGITTQPSSQRVLIGSSAAFNVSVSGTAPFNYQWFFNDTAIPDATNTVYAIPAVATNDTGNYSVMVSNAVDVATSSNAVLTVLVPPTLALQFLAGYPVLNLSGMLNNNFVVQYSTNLAGPNWVNLLSISNLSVSPYPFLDPAGAGKQSRVYRAFMQ